MFRRYLPQLQEPYTNESTAFLNRESERDNEWGFKRAGTQSELCDRVRFPHHKTTTRLWAFTRISCWASTTSTFPPNSHPPSFKSPPFLFALSHRPFLPQNLISLAVAFEIKGLKESTNSKSPWSSEHALCLKLETTSSLYSWWVDDLCSTSVYMKAKLSNMYH